MALALPGIYYDRVAETSTTTGTGTYTLAGAATNFQAFSAVGDGNTCCYCAVDRAAGGWEVGVGTYTLSGTTLARTTILASSNAGSAVSWSTGTRDVFLDFAAAFANTPNSDGLMASNSQPTLSQEIGANRSIHIIGMPYVLASGVVLALDAGALLVLDP